jgi:hypothetical protein
MDRQIVYPGSIPLDTDILSIQRNMMVALGYLAQATLGSTSVADGLVCTATNPPSMQIVVGPGSVTQFMTVDSTAFGSLAADNSDPLVKLGVNTGSTTFTLSAPTLSGYSINYLIEASLSESDTTPVVLPYYNAANPSQPYSGPNNSGVAQNTQRIQRVSLQLKPGVPAPTGSQVTPPVDTGWLPLYAVAVSTGMTQITQQQIVPVPTSPMINFKLPQLTPGFSRMLSFSSSTIFMVPQGIATMRIRLVGGGGGGAGGNASSGGGGGGAGGYAEGIFPVITGANYAITIGAGGPGIGATGTAGSGGTTSFGSLISATGGLGGDSLTPDCYGGQGGQGYGGSLAITGGWGGDGSNAVASFAGTGGGSYFGGGGRGGYGLGRNGTAPGSGGGGCYGASGNGGNGAPGVVILEY